MEDETPWIDIKKLKPHPLNPREHTDEQIKKIARSIKELDWGRPIIISNDNYILAGHGAYLAAKDELQLQKVPYRQMKWKHNDPEALAYMEADNKLGEESYWNYDKLQSLNENIKMQGFDITLTGFDDVELKEIETTLANKKEIIEDNYDPDEATIEPRVQKGDLWKLDKHFIFCGDATVTLEMDDLMRGKKADLIITDPPYNVDYTGATKDKLKIQNDNMDPESFYQFLLKSFQNMNHAVADGSSIYIFHADTEGLNFRKAFTQAGFKLAQCCIWAKQSIVMGRQDYHWQHEPILYGWKPTTKHHWYGDRKQSTIWQFQKPAKNKEHPTMKPIELIAYPIKNSSQINDIILDPFAGSGSTLIAAEQLQRQCYTMELDPHYCDVIINRWETFTGKKAVIHKN